METDSPQIVELQQKSRVSVLWKEAGQSYEGFVEKVHLDGSYDIVYDALIQGNVCRENHVSLDRITVINTMEQDDSYWNDSQNQSTYPQGQFNSSSQAAVDSPHQPQRNATSSSSLAAPSPARGILAYSLEQNIIVEKICRMYGDDQLNLEEIEDTEIISLFEALTFDKLLSLAKTSPSKLKQIFDAFVLRLERFENILGIMETMNVFQGEFEQEACKEINLLLICTTASIRISTILNSEHIKSEIHAPIPEENFEKVLRFIHTFFKVNLADSKKQSSAKGEKASPNPQNASPLKEAKTKVSDSLTKKFVNYLVSSFLPQLLSLTNVLQLFLKGSKPSSAVTMLLIDLSFDILRLEPATNPIVASLDIRIRPLLVTLFKGAVFIVKLLYQGSEETYRTIIEQSIIQLLHDCYEVKNPFRPILVDNMAINVEDNAKDHRLSTGTYCLFSCIQALIKSPTTIQKANAAAAAASSASSSSKVQAHQLKAIAPIEPEDMMSDCNNLISNILIRLFQYCANNKELSAEYYQVFLHLLQECLLASQSPIWPSAGILLEKSIYSLFLQLKKAVEDSGPGAETVNAKRDIYQINQIIDILSTLAEQISLIEREVQQLAVPPETLNALLSLPVAAVTGKYVQSGDTAGSASHTGKALALREFISQLIRLKWKQVQPLWSKLLSQFDANEEMRDSYWENEAPSSPAFSPIKKKKSGSSAIELLPYLKQLDSVIEINSDILDLVEERIQLKSFDHSAEISAILNDGAIDLTLQLLSSIHETQDLARLLSEVQNVDVKYGRLLRYIIEQNGDYRFYSQDSLDQSTDEGLNRDACLFMISFWAQYKKYHQQRQESCPALLQLAVHLTESQISDSKNPNIIQRTIMPYFVQELKTQPRRLITELTRSILSQRSLQPLLAKLLEAELYMIGDSSPLVRARSVKALSKFIQSNMEVILKGNAKLTETIIAILYDRSIAVREEGVKLIGPIISSGFAQNDLGNRLLEELKPLLLDEGISVRKSVVMILRDILQNQPIHVQYIDLCIRLLERLSTPKEEESIKEAICTIFQQIWFSPPSLNAIQVMRSIFASSSSSSLSSSDGRSKEKLPIENPYYQLGLLSRALSKGKDTGKDTTMKDFKDFHIEFTALQLIEISLVESSHAWILTLLQELLHQKEKGNETSTAAKQRRDASYQHCDKIIAFMKELLILIEEKRHQAVNDFLLARNFSASEYKVAIIATISLFCEAHPPFVSQHLLTFLPYLKGDSDLTPQQNMAVSSYVIKILEGVALLEKSNLSFANSDKIIEDLVNIAFTQSGRNISSSISCMATLISCVTLDGTPYMKLAEKCFVSLAQTIQSLPDDSSKISQLQPQQSARLQRCLVIYGYLCEHSKKCKGNLLNLPSNYLVELDVDSTVFKKQLIALNERVAQMKFRDITGFDTRIFYGIGFSVVLFALGLKDPAVQLRAVQCLCGIFAGYPRIMLLAKEKHHITHILSDHFNETVHERFLIGLKEMMVSEEQLLEKKASVQQMKESGVAISHRNTVLGGSVDHDSDATIAGFVLQQYHKDLTEFLKRPSISLRYCTLQLFATLLRQGMICPLDILALAIMLLGDENEEIRQESLKLLQIQDERHPNFLDSRLIEGIEAAHDFQFNTFQKLSPTLPKQREIDTSHSIFSNLYLTCIVPNRKRMIQFLYGLLRKCITTVAESAASSSLSSSVSALGEAENSSPIKSSASAINTTSPASKSASMLAAAYKKGTPSKTAANTSIKITEKNLANQIENLNQRFSKVKYYAMTLATLPFISIDEVLHIIHWIGRTIPTDCVMILRKLETLYSTFGGSIGHPAPPPPPSAPPSAPTNEGSVNNVALTRSTKKNNKNNNNSNSNGSSKSAPAVETNTTTPKSSSSSSAGDPLDSQMILNEEKLVDALTPLVTASGASGSSPSIHQLIYDFFSYQYQLRCEEILIRLKSYFKIVYNLSDEKCQLFDPNEKTASSSSSSSSERLNNDRYFDFQFSPTDVTPLENLLAKEKVQALLSFKAKDKEKDKEQDKDNTIHQQREASWKLIFQQCVLDYNRVHHIIHTDGDDFKLESHLSSTGGGGRRKRNNATTTSTADKGSSSTAKKKKAGKGKTTSGKKGAAAKRKRLEYEEDDEDDEEEDEKMEVDEDDDEDSFQNDGAGGGVGGGGGGGGNKSTKRAKTSSTTPSTGSIALAETTPPATPSSRSNRRSSVKSSNATASSTSAVSFEGKSVKQHHQQLFEE